MLFYYFRTDFIDGMYGNLTFLTHLMRIIERGYRLHGYEQVILPGGISKAFSRKQNDNLSSLPFSACNSFIHKVNHLSKVSNDCSLVNPEKLQ